MPCRPRGEDRRAGEMATNYEVLSEIENPTQAEETHQDIGMHRNTFLASLSGR